LSFNLIGAGGLAWRLGRRLGIPAAGWATGNDVRVPTHSSYGRAVRQAVQRLDIVFYQSRELRECAAKLTGVAPQQLAVEKHLVLPRGIEPPPKLDDSERRQWRQKLGLAGNQILIVYVGRIIKAKGVFELVDAAAAISSRRRGVVCLLVGAKPGFDDADALRMKMATMPGGAQNIHLVPECPPEDVWRYLHAADVFAFPSHSEGMPNSLLEAMATGLPAVVYAIPPMLDIDNGSGALMLVPPLDAGELCRCLGALVESPAQRQSIGKKAQRRVLNHFMARETMAEAVKQLALVVAKSRSTARSSLLSQTA
jgi:glycosyltransferase involved in cell wall biosynthesis